jgi:cysteinyl-tRNA synthetase
MSNQESSNETKNFYVTSPIYYVNDVPHIGHGYTSIACDIIANSKRMEGYNVFFLTGTDEHGQKVEKSAIKANKTPQEFCNEISQKFFDLTKTLKLSNDDFIRTTESRHKKVAKNFWSIIEKNLTGRTFVFFLIVSCRIFSHLATAQYIWSIDIKSLQNRLLKVCYVPATSTSLPRVSFFFSLFVAAAIDSTNEANKVT